jgi:hypothetical protein
LRSITSKPWGSTLSIFRAWSASDCVDLPVRPHLRIIAHAAQQPVGDARGAARTARDLGGAFVVQRIDASILAERRTMRVSSSGV